jgi:hypothetical protein
MPRKRGEGMAASWRALQGAMATLSPVGEQEGMGLYNAATGAAGVTLGLLLPIGIRVQSAVPREILMAAKGGTSS